MLNRAVSFFQQDPAVATLLTTIGMSFLTGALFLVKKFFSSILDYINIHFAVTISVSNRESLYYHLLDELVSIKPNLIKRLKLVGIKNPNEDYVSNVWNIEKSVDDFYSYFFYKPFVPVKLFCTVKEKENTLDEKIELYIVFFMWHRKYLIELMNNAIKRELGDNYKDKISRYSDKLIPYIYNDHIVSSSHISLYNLTELSFSSFFTAFNISKAKTFNDLHLSNDVKNNIIGRLDKFYSSREFYKKYNTPYRLGMLLYGKPGTGKTSIIKAIAHHYKKPVVFIDVKKITELKETLEDYSTQKSHYLETLFLHELFVRYGNLLKDSISFNFSDFKSGFLNYKSISSIVDITYEEFINLLNLCSKKLEDIIDKVMPILVIEDIDCIPSFTKRKDNKSLKDSLPKDVNEEVSVGDDTNVFNDIFYDNMSTILNVLDGVVPHSDFVIIGTTNRIDVIDDAFKRPGRFDVVIEVPPISEETFALFCKANYPNSKLPRTFKLKEDVSMAYLQEDHFKGLTFEEIKEKYLK